MLNRFLFIVVIVFSAPPLAGAKELLGRRVPAEAQPPNPATKCDPNDCSGCETAPHPEGNERAFLDRCLAGGVSMKTCQELTRPNPDEIGRFRCTYGDVRHVLIPPSSEWAVAIQLAKVYEGLKRKGICTQMVYNWWRPEPYNTNVEGAPGRHPNGTCIDVRFCNVSETRAALHELCGLMQSGAIKSVGYYGSTGVHIGMDPQGGTWGGACDQ